MYIKRSNNILDYTYMYMLFDTRRSEPIDFTYMTLNLIVLKRELETRNAQVHEWFTTKWDVVYQ